MIPVSNPGTHLNPLQSGVNIFSYKGIVIGYALPGKYKTPGLSLNLDSIPVKQAIVRIEGN